MKSIAFNVSKTPNKVVISGTEGERVKTVEFDRRVYDVLESCTEPVSNGELQQRLAEAMRIPAPGGRCSKAASLLERYTLGYRAFNGWCALLIGTSVNNKRFYQFNPDFAVKEDAVAAMLTKQGKLISEDESEEDNDYQEDLDIPEGYEASADDMNEIIDQAYEILGFDPQDLPEDAPDLTYEEAVKVLRDHE